MSLSNSRRSNKMREDGEFYLECKAAFLTELEDIDDKIDSKKMLISLLQTTGRNPTKTTLNKYWTSSTSSLSFNDFVDICNKEPATSADDLMKAFRKIDINGDGYISLDELYKIMNKKEKGMTRDEVRKMIDEVDDNKDGRLDYREKSYKDGKLYYNEFTNMVMKTTEDSKKMSKKVMERKERKKKRGELSAAQSDIGNNSDSVNTHTTSKTGSQVSLQTGRKGSIREDRDRTDLESDPYKTDKSDNIGSTASLRSSRRESKSSVKTPNVTDNQGSSLSLQKHNSDRVKGSVASLRSESHTKTTHDEAKPSRASLDDDDDDDDVVLKSKTSIRSAVKESKTPRELGVKQGSHVSLASTLKGSLDVEQVADASKRRGSASSQRSQSSKQEEPQSSSKSMNVENIPARPTGSPKSMNVDNSSVRPTTPRSRLGIPSIQDLERPGSSYSNRESPRGGTLVTNTHPKMSGINDWASSAAKDDTEASSPFKLNIPKDSARSVGEEISYDDDFDIVSTGRPTPRVSLSSRGGTPKGETPRSVKDEASKPKKDVEQKEGKGKSLDKSANEGSLSTMHEDKGVEKKGDGKSESDANLDKKTKSDTTQRDQGKPVGSKDVSIKEKDDDKHREDANTRQMDGDSKPIDEKKYENGKPEQKDDDAKLSKTNGMSRSQTEKKPPSGKENSGLGSIKAEDEKTNELLMKLAKSLRSNDTDMGSQSSLKSGDKDGGVPVPSPRKAVTRGLEDDIPRPSPRVRSSKMKSPSSSFRSKDKLPDPGSLRDWSKLTSKGCFFYEEDEIVSHVYNLKLFEDSMVYLSSSPITDQPKSLHLPGAEPIDTALYVFDSRGNVITFTEQRDVEGTFGVKLELSAGEYQILPYTTGCRFKQRAEKSGNMKESKLIKKDKDQKIVITTAFRQALEDIFTLCDLDDNNLMSKDEFNWFNVRTSGEELGDDEWAVVEDKIELKDGQIQLEGFIELNEMEAEDAEGVVDDLWITLTSMGMNKSLMMDEACPYRLNVFVKDVGRKKPRLSVTGIESLEKREFVTAISQSLIEKVGEPTSIRNMKDLYLYTYKNDYRATMVIDNRSRSTVQLEIDCTKSRNVISNRSGLDHTFEIDPQQTAIAHHLMPQSEVKEWSVINTETIHK